MRFGIDWHCECFISVPFLQKRSKFDTRDDFSEPLEIRNNRVLIFFECITIFGLFFISSAWAFYEWSLYRVPEYGLLLENILEVCFGVALSCSSALAFLVSPFGSRFTPPPLDITYSRVDICFAREGVRGLATFHLTELQPYQLCVRIKGDTLLDDVSLDYLRDERMVRHFDRYIRETEPVE